MDATGIPAIAVSAGFTDYGDYLGLALSRPLVAAGAVPFLLPYLEDQAERAQVLDRVDGLVLGFGRDIAPERYGASPHSSMTEISPLRDAFELALATEALERGMPILGICRGMQVLNVALGGTLYRDRSEYPPAAREHPGGDWARWQLVCAATLGSGSMPEHPSHPIAVTPGSALAAALGERAVVNSYHHQAVKDLGDGLRVVARSDDGIIEAIEHADLRHVLGVQWEAQEAWQDGAGGVALFRGFVAAAASAAASEDRLAGRRAGSAGGSPRAAERV
jgi:putative glutamine amidotransferase